ncbi:MAG: SIS domain-containing protein [Pseudomonadota bacterium]
MAGTFEDFVTDYYAQFAQSVLDFGKGPLKDVLAVFDQVMADGGTLWVAGNGGSAGIANHIVCDCSKGTYLEGHPPLRTVSLSANTPLLTALGNDIGYDAVFSEPLKYYLQDKDALLVVSSSGNSPNVVAACDYANAKGVPTVAFVGFKGGRLAEIAKHVVHVPVDNYGIVEDIHMSVIHVLTQYIRGRSEGAF